MGKHDARQGQQSTYEQNGGQSTKSGGGGHRTEAGSELPPRGENVRDINTARKR